MSTQKNSGKSLEDSKASTRRQRSQRRIRYLDNSPVFECDEIDYTVKDAERGLVHIKMYIGARFSQETGEEVAQYNIQKFNITDFKNFEAKVTRLGYKYCFLHKPAGFKSKFEV